MTVESTQSLMEDMLHPVRMRILMHLAGSQGLTPLQIAEGLPDVPQATLYRHISRLVKAGLLQVVDARPVRGTVEKVYAISAAAHLTNEDMSLLSQADHLRFFTAFTVNLIDQFSRYLNSGRRIDMAADGVGYSQVALWMSDAQLGEFAQAINALILPYMQAQPAPGQTKRFFATIMMPEPTAISPDHLE